MKGKLQSYVFGGEEGLKPMSV